MSARTDTIAAQPNASERRRRHRSFLRLVAIAILLWLLVAYVIMPPAAARLALGLFLFAVVRMVMLPIA